MLVQNYISTRIHFNVDYKAICGVIWWEFTTSPLLMVLRRLWKRGMHSSPTERETNSERLTRCQSLPTAQYAPRLLMLDQRHCVCQADHLCHSRVQPTNRKNWTVKISRTSHCIHRHQRLNVIGSPHSSDNAIYAGCVWRKSSDRRKIPYNSLNLCRKL